MTMEVWLMETMALVPTFPQVTLVTAAASVTTAAQSRVTWTLVTSKSPSNLRFIHNFSLAVNTSCSVLFCLISSFPIHQFPPVPPPPPFGKRAIFWGRIREMSSVFRLYSKLQDNIQTVASLAWHCPGNHSVLRMRTVITIPRGWC